MQTLSTNKGFAIQPKYYINSKKRSISEKHKVANIFNKYFVNITKTLNIPEWKPQKGLTFQNLDIILDRFSHHPSVIQIKEKHTRISLVSVTFSLGKLTEQSST